jgi:hypothetical protein
MRTRPAFRPPLADVMIVLFLVAFVGSATIFQIYDELPPWRDRSAIDMMNGGMIWMLSALALVMAILRAEQPGKAGIWLLGCAALGLVAIDELMGLHERARHIRDDDDPKIAMAVGAGVALYILVRTEALRGRALRFLMAGFAVHILYLLSDMGDGDFFSIALELDTLRWIEEYLEVTAMCCYFVAFVTIVVEARRSAPVVSAQAPAPAEAPAGPLPRRAVARGAVARGAS